MTVHTTHTGIQHADIPTEERSAELIVTLARARGQSLEAQVIQISTEEARVRISESLIPGETIQFTISDRSGHSIWKSSAEVHWSRFGAGGCDAGMIFQQRVSEEITTRTQWDRRNQLRYPVQIAAHIWWDSSEKSVPVKVLNFSSNGIGVLAQEPGPIGKKFLLATSKNQVEQIVVQGKCCWQVSQVRGYLIGCQLAPQQGRRFSDRVLQEDHQRSGKDLCYREAEKLAEARARTKKTRMRN